MAPLGVAAGMNFYHSLLARGGIDTEILARREELEKDMNRVRDELREQIRQEVLGPALADNAFAFDMNADGVYTRRVPPAGEPARGAQLEVFEGVVRRTLQVVAKA